MRDLERYTRNIRNENRATITTHKNEPKRNEGKNGDIRITTTTAEGVKLFSKYQGEWYTTPLSKYIIKDHNKTKRDIDAMSSLGTTGYQEFNSGLIIQWGLVTDNGAVTVTFPKTFPTACLNVVVGKSGTTSGIPRVESITSTNFAFNNSDTADGDAYWQAIGH